MPELVNERFLLRHAGMFEKILLVATIKSVKFYRAMKDRLCPYEERRKARRPDFTRPEYNRVFGLVADYWEQVGPALDPALDYAMRLPDLEEMFRSEIDGRRLTNEEAIAWFDALKMDIELFDFEPGVLLRLGEDRLVTSWLNRRSTNNIIEFAYNQRTMRAVTLEDIKAQVEHAQVALTSRAERIVRGSDLIYARFPSLFPVEVDLEGINKATSGGLRANTTTLVAACNGGGKTVLAMQWAKHFASLGLNVVVFTTEQPPHELMTRVLSNHLSIDYGMLMNRAHPGLTQGLSIQECLRVEGVSHLLPEELFRTYEAPLREFYYEIYPRLLFVDWSNASSTIYGNFEMEMAKLDQTGWIADVVIFDWIGGGLDNVRNLGNLKMDTRLLYKEAIEALIKHGKRTRRIMIAFAQLNKEKVGNNPFIQMRMLGECLSMTDNVTNFIGISSVTEKDSTPDGAGVKPQLRVRQYMNLAKSRFGPGGHVAVDANFRYQKFSPAAGRL